MLTDSLEVSQVTRSDKSYKPVEKKVERAIEKKEAVGEEDLDKPEDDLIL